MGASAGWLVTSSQTARLRGVPGQRVPWVALAETPSSGSVIGTLQAMPAPPSGALRGSLATVGALKSRKRPLTSKGPSTPPAGRACAGRSISATKSAPPTHRNPQARIGCWRDNSFIDSRSTISAILQRAN